MLSRADLVFGAFEAQCQPLSLSDLARRTGLPKTTAHRTVSQLFALGWLTRSGDNYALSDRVFRLAAVVPGRMELREVALPFLEDLYEATHETVHLAVRDGLAALYVEKISGHRKITSLTRVGGHMPLYCTGVGKVLLAYADEQVVEQVLDQGMPARTSATITQPGLMRAELRRIRELGLAYDREESTVGMTCVAAPVAGGDGQVVAAISVTGGARRFHPHQLGPAVRAAALGIGRGLGTPAQSRLSRPASLH